LIEMKAKELRNRTQAELTEEVTSLLRAQFNLRMQHATQQLAKSSELNKVRRDIARVRTVATELSRAAQTAAAKPAGKA
jgi:large subunit ribosomal protein L29